MQESLKKVKDSLLMEVELLEQAVKMDMNPYNVAQAVIATTEVLKLISQQDFEE